MHRLHAYFHTESDESDKQVRIAYQGYPLAVEIRMAVGKSIHYPAAFFEERSWNRQACQFTNSFQQLVGSGNTKWCGQCGDLLLPGITDKVLRFLQCVFLE
ncbi:hypothetical protein D3C85_1335100 [compost metagenome]